MKIPDERGFATKGELARDIVRRCITASLTGEARGRRCRTRPLPAKPLRLPRLLLTD